MLRITLYCLILAVTVSIVESGISKRSSSCAEAENCLKPRENFKPYGRFVDVFDLIDESKMQQFCVLAAAQTLCVRNKKSNCQNGQYYSWRTVLDDYFCSDTYRSEIKNLNKSPCSTNFGKQREAISSLEDCHRAYSSRLRELMESGYNVNGKNRATNIALNDWRACCSRAATNKCGPEYGKFVRDIAKNEEIRFNNLVLIP